jgi:DNA polymerase II small subunit
MNKIVSYFAEHGYLIKPEILDLVDKEADKEEFLRRLESAGEIAVINKDFLRVVSSKEKININWMEFENSLALYEMGKEAEVYQAFIDIIDYNVSEEKREQIKKFLEETKKAEADGLSLERDNNNAGVIVLRSYQDDAKKREIDDFIAYFRVRYRGLKQILQNRQELQNTVSINRLKGKKKGEMISLIGMVNDKRVTKNGNVFLNIEDESGNINVLINKSKEELYRVGSDILLDEVIGINGALGENVVFVNNVYFPDVPLGRELKKVDEECYVAFISDIHVGSKMFMEKEFKNFLSWLNGETGEKTQREMAKKVRYIFICGDLVDGVGVYPGQEEDLAIKDIYEQYKKLAEYFEEIPKEVNVVVCPGNHDALRSSEPQPAIRRELFGNFYKRNNVFFVSNPSMVNIHSSRNFPGFNILIYHGGSFHYYIDNVTNLREKNARDNPVFISKFLLEKRHLAPTYASNVCVPYKEVDPLLIDVIPDIFVSGEMHRSGVLDHNSITMISCSCWQAKTEYQERTGNNPDPCKVPILNLMNRQIKILNFSDGSE